MTRAEPVRAITNVTAFLGERFEPAVVDIHIRDGVVERITPADQPARRPDPVRDGAPGATVIDGSGMLAFPGMIDGHDHLRNLTPGLSIGEGLKLDDFLTVMWSTQQAMGTTEYRLGALLGTLQRLKTGITTVVDHCYTFHAPGLDEAALSGYEGSGVRWVYARGIMTRPYEPVCETWATAERRIRELVASGRVPRERLFIAPVSIRQATPEEFQRCRALADELGCGLYTHVAETTAEREVWQNQVGASPIHALDRLGFLTPHTVLVHCVFLEDSEISLLAERGCHVVHCPTNNMKLAKGFTRVPDLLRAGVNVALGVDMMADLFVEMRVEMGMHAAHRQDPNAVPKLEALRMATHRGAQALGYGEVLGVIAPGRRADLVLLEGRSLLQAPMIDPVYALLYATHPGDVRHVLVDGRLVIRNGVSTLVDEAALLAEVEDAVTAYIGRIGVPQGAWFARARTVV